MIKISNQTVHHQSATKFASVLQDIKNYQPVILPKYFWYCAKKKTTTITTITNIFNHVNHVNTDPGVPRTFSQRFFLKQSYGYPKYISDVEFVIFLKLGFLWWKLKIFISNFSHLSPNRFWRISSMLLNSHPTIKWRWKKWCCNCFDAKPEFDWTNSEKTSRLSIERWRNVTVSPIQNGLSFASYNPLITLSKLKCAVPIWANSE